MSVLPEALVSLLQDGSSVEPMFRVVVSFMFFDRVPAYPRDEAPFVSVDGLDDISASHASTTLHFGNDGGPELPCEVPCILRSHIDGRPGERSPFSKGFAIGCIVDQMGVSNNRVASHHGLQSCFQVCVVR